MPTYKYQCECGVRFEHTTSMKNAMKPQPCPDCRELAERLMPGALSSTFNQSANSPAPQNTGVHSFDTNWDRVIGASAKEGWDTQRRRYKDKVQTLKDNPGATGHDLARAPEAEGYRVLKKEEKGVFDRIHAINNLATERLKNKK